MEEIRIKRNLTSKHFLLEDGSFKMNVHIGHIHYFNKLGVGDSNGDFRSIDWTLNWDEKKRGWGFQYHSFHPFLPEFADEWVEFRDVFGGKDQIIKYKAHASHIKGRLVMPKDIGLEKETDANCVIYDDAFGEGIDYILYFTRSTLKKVVRIRDGYKSKDDMKFVFDIDIPTDLKVFRGGSKEKISYELDTTRDKQFDTSKQTLIGQNNENSDDEMFTYLRGFKVWDSGEKENYHKETIVVDYDAQNKTITKIVSAEFLNKAVGDIFTDTTTSYYAGA